MFAERGLRATTVRDIADSAGILSGSLYHHFKSKEQMVDEVLRGLPRLAVRPLPGDRRRPRPNPLERLKGLFMASFEAIEHRHAQVVIYQDEAKRLSALPQFAYRRRAQPRAAQDVGGRAQPGHRGGLLPARPRRRPGLPVHPRHHLGFGPLVSAGRTAHGRSRSAGSTSPSFSAESRKKETDMTCARGVRHRRCAHRGRQAQRIACRRASRRPRRRGVARSVRPRRRRSRRRRRRDRRLRRRHRRPGGQHRPAVVAGRRLSPKRCPASPSTASAVRASRPFPLAHRRSCPVPPI